MEIVSYSYKAFHLPKKEYPQLMKTAGVQVERAQRSSALICSLHMTEIRTVTVGTFETFKLHFGVIHLEKIMIHNINVWILNLDSNPIHCKPH